MAAYQDFRQFFFIYDNGKVFQQEFQIIQNFQVGARYIAYVDYNSDFKVYFSGGTVTQIQRFAPASYTVTDEMVVYLNAGNFLFAIYNNQQYELGQVKAYSFGDSVIVFKDIFDTDWVFFDGKTTQLENRNIIDIAASDNLVAYFDFSDQFKVWYHGQVLVLEQGVAPSSFIVNRNIVAYVDYLGGFKVFSKGHTYKLDSFAPKEYKTGEDFVAYIDQNNTFKVFTEGKEVELSTIPPRYWEIKEDVLVFVDNNNFFYAYYKGKVQRLENYVPASYQIDDGIVVYPDLDRRLHGYVNGQFQQVSGGEVTNLFKLTNQAVFFNRVQSQNKLFCNGKIINAL
ncbi:MAG: hypothetical protein SFW35_09990 [Chitinophagales bacterium]|nr:hypothetical protein [Chitinophagales bacterium]